MRKVAFLTSANMIRPGPDLREDAFEHDLQFSLFTRAAAQHDIELVEVIWDEANVDWSVFDAVLVGTTWDYVQKLEQFSNVMMQIDGQTRLFNSLDILQMNMNKQYLLDLADKGVPVVPTISMEKVTRTAVKAAFESFGCEQLVIKPTIGAGAWRQVLLHHQAPWPSAAQLPPKGAFVQPYLSQIQFMGELSMLFYGGEFSHAVRKTPKAGDYRIQSIYGGHEQAEQPSSAEMTLARQALSALGRVPLYARVDAISDDSGQPLLIELELIEPYHYVEQGPDCGAMLMSVLANRI